MLKVAILDDYQNVSQQFVDIEKLSGKYEIKIFSEPFEDEADILDKLSDFEALLVMRERTPITKNIIDNFPDAEVVDVDLINKGARVYYKDMRKYMVIDRSQKSLIGHSDHGERNFFSRYHPHATPKDVKWGY